MRGRGITLGQVRGIPIRVDASWLVIATLIVWTLSVAYFPGVVPGLDRALYWLAGSLAALCFFGSVLLHELSHCLVAIRAGLPVRSVTLFIFGGVSEITSEPPSPKIEFWMAAAGPAASFTIAALVYGVAWLVDQVATPGTRTTLVQAGLGYLAAINLLLGIFNLVPGFPLDGGRMLRAGLWHWQGNLDKATRWASVGGKVVAALLMGVGAIVLFNGGVVAGLWYGFIGLFLWQAADTAYAQLQLTQGLQGHRVGDVMTRPAVAVPADLSLAAFIDEFVFRERHNGYPVVDGGRPIGLITVQQVRDVPQPRWRETTVHDVMTRLYEPLQATDDLAVAVKRLTEAGVSQFPVVSQGQLIGIISFTDLALVMARLPLEQRRAA